MNLDLNPYASPVAVDAERALRGRNELMWRLRGPSLGLLVLAGLHAAFALMAIPAVAMSVVNGRDLWPTIFIFLGSLPSAFICFCAWRMRQMRSLGLCRLGAILACIPLLSPVFYLGIPFGIWAVVVLYMPSTAAAFDQPPPLMAEVADE